MTAETLSRQVHDLFSSVERVPCSTHEKHDKREPEFFKEKLRCAEMLVCAAKIIVAMTTNQIN